jgi:hypothetical protein
MDHQDTQTGGLPHVDLKAALPEARDGETVVGRYRPHPDVANVLIRPNGARMNGIGSTAAMVSVAHQLRRR